MDVREVFETIENLDDRTEDDFVRIPLEDYRELKQMFFREESAETTGVKE